MRFVAIACSSQTAWLTRRRAVIWRWLYTVSYEQWLWSSLMINQYDGQAYSDYCHGAGSTLEAVAGLLPGPALAPPAQLAAMAGASASPRACRVRAWS